MTHSFPTRRSSDLDIRRNRSNVAARCGSCDHRGVVDGGVLWRWFALHRWKSRPTDLVEHMRCSIRSEEHTSELQSLMRISYAVFCLKKKTKKQIRITP